jgi:hypothetical protein
LVTHRRRRVKRTAPALSQRKVTLSKSKASLKIEWSIPGIRRTLHLLYVDRGKRNPPTKFRKGNISHAWKGVTYVRKS